MNEGSAPERIAVIWSPDGRSDLRAIDFTDQNTVEITHVHDRKDAYR